MAENNQFVPACDLSGVREAVCVHANKVMDACRDKDCIEDLRVYLTRDSQALLDRANGARVQSAELLFADPVVEAVPYNAGSFTVTVTFYYKIIATVTIEGNRPATVYGLAVFSKQVLLYGGEGSAKVYTSRDNFCAPDRRNTCSCGLPTAIIEVVDPMVLAAKILNITNCPCNTDVEAPNIPPALLACFDDDLVLNGEKQRLLVTIGQFSILRLERDTQLLMPCYDYCIPTKECGDVSGISPATACDVFSQVDFPIDSFFPGRKDTCTPPSGSCNCCGNGYRTT